MAVINPTSADVGGDGNARLWTWALTTADHTGAGIEQIQAVDLCWQATGDFGGTGVVSAEGSNDGTNWFALTNASGGSAATFSAAGGKQTVERPRFVRARLSTVGTAATPSVTLMARKNPVK